MWLEAIKGDVTHETSRAAMTCYQFLVDCYFRPEKSYQHKAYPGVNRSLNALINVMIVHLKSKLPLP